MWVGYRVVLLSVVGGGFVDIWGFVRRGVRMIVGRLEGILDFLSTRSDLQPLYAT